MLWGRLFFPSPHTSMKIIQTLWLDDITMPFQTKAGWFSAEYHWMSWAFSCLQLKQFYNEVELITNAKGKEILIDKLQLPYTKFTIITFPELVKTFWSLAKIEAYSIQNEPFIHIDGDIFIWKKFDDLLEKSPLITQNSEDWFAGYDYMLQQFNDQKLPSFVETNTALLSYNLGIVGGENIQFFKHYKEEVLRFVKNNQRLLEGLVETHNHSYVNMFIEQFLFTQLAHNQHLEVSTLFSEKVTDPDYPDITNFYNVPQSKTFVHLLGRAKGVPEICQTLSKHLRESYPKQYYHVLRTCLENGVTLHSKAYSLLELSPLTHSETHFKEILDTYVVENNGYFQPYTSKLNSKIRYFSSENQELYSDFQQYEFQRKEYQTKLASNVFLYAKGMVNFTRLQKLLSLTENQFLNQTLHIGSQVCIIETTWNWTLDDLSQNINQNKAFYHILLFPDIHSLIIKEQVLDSLNMIILDSFNEQITIREAIENCAIYFEDNTISSKQFTFLIRERIRDLMILGALEWIT